MKHLRGIFAAACLCNAPVLLATDCSRDDIDHYLDRGFSPEQVLELCRPSRSLENNGAAPENAQNEVDFLRESLAAYAIKVDEQALRYSRELCVHYDRPNLAQQQKKACGEAHYEIAWQGLRVIDSRRKLLFWGRNALEVQGQINRQYELGQEQLSDTLQGRLNEALEQGDKTELPVREGVPLDKLKNALEQLAR